MPYKVGTNTNFRDILGLIWGTQMLWKYRWS